MLKIFALTLLLLQDDEKEFNKFRSESMKKEEKGEWKKIDWQKDMAAALEKAKADTKPILVFMVVGKMGKKGAAEC